MKQEEKYKNKYLRLKEVKKRIKNKNKTIEEVVNILIKILEEEQECNKGNLTEYDIVNIYELLTGEII